MPTSMLALLPLVLAPQGAPAPLPSAARTALDHRLEAAGPAAATWLDAEGHRAAGLDWKATIGPGGTRFTPALGSRTPVNLALGLALVDARVGTATIDLAAADPEPLEGSVRTNRGDLTEHWSARARGLELWVQIDRLDSRGELALRYELSGDLTPTSINPDRLECLVPDIGGASIDGVVGIDGLGRTTAGWMRPVEGGVEFVLPAEFVASAALPLIVDPLISTVTPTGLTLDSVGSDIAHDPNTGTWLAVWELEFSAGDRDIYAWRRSAEGTSVGSLIPIATSSDDEIEPAVGANPNTDEWIVAWAAEVAPGNHDLFARRVSTDGVVGGPPSAIRTGPPDAREPVLTDEWPGIAGDDDLLIVWDEDAGDLSWALLTHPVAGVPTIAPGSVVSFDVNGSDVHISRSGGEAGRHLIVWQNGVAQQLYYLSGVVVSREGLQLFSSPSLESGVNVGEFDPFAVGDGEEFYVAHIYDDPAQGELVGVRHLRWGTGLDLVTLFEQVSEDDGFFSKPVAELVGGQLVVAWQELQFIIGFLQYASLDAPTLAVCEPETTVPLEVLGQFDLAMAAGEGQALWTWSELDPVTLTSTLVFQPFQPVTSISAEVDLGGGTVGGGACYAPCSVVGNGDFALRLEDHAPSSVSFLALGGGPPPGIVCGGGTFLLDPFATFLVSVPTPSLATEREYAIAIPNTTELAGLTFTAQWFTPAAGAACPLFGVELSNGLRFRVE